MAKEGQKKGGGTKRKRKNSASSKRWNKYNISGDNIKREKTCPRCGPGIFLAKHKGRLHCGKCNYTEFLKE